MTSKLSTELHKVPALFWLCLGLAGLFMVCCGYFLAPPLAPQGQAVKLAGMDASGAAADINWTVYVTEDGVTRPLADLGDGIYSGLAREGQTFYASCVLESAGPDAILEITTPYPTALFLGGELLYSDAELSAPQIGRIDLPPADNMRTEPLLVSLPTEYAGRVLTIAQAQYYGSADPVLDVYIPDATLLSLERYNSGQISAGAEVFYPGIALFVLSAFLLVVTLVNAYYGNSVAAPLLLSTFCVLWMICLYTGSVPLQLLGYYEPLPYYALFYYGGTACLVLFIADFMAGAKRRMLRVLAMLPFAAALATALVPDAGAGDLTIVPELLQIGALTAAIILACLSAGRTDFFTVFRRLLLTAALVFSVFVAAQAAAGSAWFQAFAQQLRLRYTFAGLASLIQGLLVAAGAGSLAWELIRRLNRRRLETVLAEERQHMAEASLSQYKRHTQETAMLQHDIRRHLAMVGLFLKDGRLPQALDYLDQIGLQLEAVPKVIATGNAAIDLILNAKLSEMQEAGISTDILAEELPRPLPLTEAEISSLLLNTLDNAIRAAAASADKKVSVKLYVRNGFLYYSCRNTGAAEEAAAEGAAAAHTRHGYGLQIVRQIAEQHGGVARVQQSGGNFEITCVFARVTPGTDTR